MQFEESFSLHNGASEWKRRGLMDWLVDLFQAPSLAVSQGSTKKIRDYLRTELTQSGWAYHPRVDSEYEIRVTGLYQDLGFQIQTGNISRAMYDLLKLQYLFTQRRIEAAAIAVPTKQAAETIGSNIANSERLWGELQLFDRVITVPLVVVSFS